MLEVFDIVEFKRPLQGGANQPWLVSAIGEQGMTQKVLKVFPTDRQNHDSLVAKEVLCSLLAQHFELPTPDVCMLKLHANLTLEDAPEDLREKMISSGHRVFLGFSFISGANPYTQAFDLNIRDDYEPETIFAFDLFIKNRDRRIAKPNSFESYGKYYVIDHEYCLTNLPTLPNAQDLMELASGYTEDARHIFYDYLKRKMITFSFDTFAQYMRMLNPNSFDDEVERLHRLGYHYPDYQALKTYIRETKRQLPAFIENLKGLVN